MYLIEITAFVRQILPPAWRNTWKEKALRALVSSVFGIERRFAKERFRILDEINLSGQMLVLEQLLKRVSGSAASYVGDGNFEVALFVPAGTDETPVVELAKKYIQAGVKWKIKTIN